MESGCEKDGRDESELEVEWGVVSESAEAREVNGSKNEEEGSESERHNSR